MKLICAILITLLLSSCTPSLDGSYQLDEEYLKASCDIKGNKIVLTIDGDTSTGKINKTDKSISLDHSNDSVTYDLINDKLVITIDNHSLSFTKKS